MKERIGISLSVALDLAERSLDNNGMALTLLNIATTVLFLLLYAALTILMGVDTGSDAWKIGLALVAILHPRPPS